MIKIFCLFLSLFLYQAVCESLRFSTDDFLPKTKNDLNLHHKNEIGIDLESKEGQEMLLNSPKSLDIFFKLIQNFVTQNTQAYCGIASGVMVLNSLEDRIRRPVDPTFKPYPYFTQDTFMSNSCVKKILGVENYYFYGLTMSQLSRTMKCFNVDVEEVYWNDDTELLTERIVKAIDEKHFVIGNINRGDLDEKGYGHFSPIGAYSKTKKGVNFLFLDVSRYKYTPKWFEASVLIEAMKAKDSISHQARGFMIIKT